MVLVPIGFVSDHMEVIFDLDTEAAATAAELGLAFARAATAGDHPAFVGALVDLMVERAAVARGETTATAGDRGGTVGWYECHRTAVPISASPTGARSASGPRTGLCLCRFCTVRVKPSPTAANLTR